MIDEPTASTPISQKVELFNDRSGGEQVHADIEIDADGNLALDGCCAGPMARRFFGDSDWEYRVTVPAAQKDGLLLQLLHEKYAGDTLAQRYFRDWLDARDVPHTFTHY